MAILQVVCDETVRGYKNHTKEINFKIIMLTFLPTIIRSVILRFVLLNIRFGTKVIVTYIRQ